MPSFATAASSASFTFVAVSIALFNAINRSLSSIIAVALNNADSYNKLDTANIEISNQSEDAQSLTQTQRNAASNFNYCL
mgnify:CR=1 FL=1